MHTNPELKRQVELIRKLCGLLDERPALTTSEAIVPAGAGFAISVDETGLVTGIKISRHSDLASAKLERDTNQDNYSAEAAERILSTLAQFKTLARLIFFRGRNYSLPHQITKLPLELLVLYGVSRIPREILNLSLEINMGNPELESEWIRSLTLLHEEREKRDRLQIRKETLGSSAFLRAGGLVKIDHNHGGPVWEVHPEEKLDITVTPGVYLSLASDRILKEPPPEIIQRGRKAIERYFDERARGEELLNEVKVLLVGAGGAGKTSLVKRVSGDEFDPNESQTHGIRIKKWRPSQQTPLGDLPGLKVHFWDFGGQEIMHATHQFFLSRRSVYILLLDGRKEEDAEYWLQHIVSFGGDSPILVVMNKIDENPSFDLNRRFLRDKYPSIVEFFRLSCYTTDGVKRFVHGLMRVLRDASIAQTTWPLSWFTVKERLEAIEAPFVTLDDYREICTEEDVIDTTSQETLIDFLHDLGIVLHFKEMELLDTQVLDPQWATEAVYRIINSKVLADGNGFLDVKKLKSALKPLHKRGRIYPEDKHGFIIELMRKFELCYWLPSKSTLLVPDLLPIQQPELKFDSSDALTFIFGYTQLPKSVMPRFMVRMHLDIDTMYLWRTGVVLRDQDLDCEALVIADEKDRKITIKVAGAQKREYFAILRKVLRDINASFKKMRITEKVPLPGHDGVLIDYDELVGHEISGKDELFIGRLGESFSVSRLLSGIEKREVTEAAAEAFIRIEGDYYDYSSTGNSEEDSAAESTNRRVAWSQLERWERKGMVGSLLMFVAMCGYLLIINEPIADPNLAILLRSLVSLCVAVVGGLLPGMLNVGIHAKGLLVRGTGAIGLFVLTYLLSPMVL